MKLSKNELKVMEMLWDENNLDERGEIVASDLSTLLTKKYDWPSTSNYSYFHRLLKKGAIDRRYPNFTIKPIVGRQDIGMVETKSLLDRLYEGSIVKFFSAYMAEKHIDQEELDEIHKIIESYQDHDINR